LTLPTLNLWPLGWSITMFLNCKKYKNYGKNILNQYGISPRYCPKSVRMNQVSGAPTSIFKLTVPFCARPQRFISRHFSTLCVWTHFTVYNCNKCDSKYTMRSIPTVQVVELWPIKCGSFCARTRRKAATWL
jgi:hypothetical protein